MPDVFTGTGRAERPMHSQEAAGLNVRYVRGKRPDEKYFRMKMKRNVGKMKKLSIAIDGTSGSGKSTAAKNVAKALGIEYIDTGAMYRAAAYKALGAGVSVEDDDAVRKMMDQTDIDFTGGNIFLDGENVNDRIRTLEISAAASQISKLPGCREKLVEIQRKIAAAKSVVMDGRDIGTNVLKDATHKFYVTASLEIRTERRLKELRDKGQNPTYEEVFEDLKIRDHNDMNRDLNPLVQAEDAVFIDTGDYDIPGTAEAILSHVR